MTATAESASGGMLQGAIDETTVSSGAAKASVSTLPSAALPATVQRRAAEAATSRRQAREHVRAEFLIGERPLGCTQRCLDGVKLFVHEFLRLAIP